MTEMFSLRPRGLYFLVFSAVAGCTARPTLPIGPADSVITGEPGSATPGVARPSLPASVTPPDGWLIACDGLELAGAAYSGYRGLSYYVGRETEDHLWYHEVSASDAIDVQRTIKDSVDRIPTVSDSPTCSLAADLDGDGIEDEVLPLVHPSDMRPGLLVQWGDGRPPSTVGTDRYGHIAPVPGFPVCAWSLSRIVDRSGWTFDAGELGEPIKTVKAPLPGRGDALALYDDKWLFFDGEGAYFLNPQADFGGTAYPRDVAWTDEPPPPACAKAKRRRRRTYVDESEQRVMWYPAREVAQDACELELDLDGVQGTERVRWAEVSGKTGLRIDWSDGRSALLGAGNRVPIEVLPGEPGCNEAPESFNNVWDVDVAPWDGTSWMLPDGRPHTPTRPELVEGSALAMTNAEGHVDVVFLSDGQWRRSAVPFEWDRYFVFWPAMEQWNWVQKPPPAGARYHRPSPAHRAWIRKHTPGPPPTDAGRFYPGH